MSDENKARKLELVEQAKAIQWNKQVEIDTEAYEDLSWDDMESIQLALVNLRGVEKAAVALAKIVKKCPQHWGDPSDPATYRKLSFRKVIVPLFEHISAEVSGKN